MQFVSKEYLESEKGMAAQTALQKLSRSLQREVIKVDGNRVTVTQNLGGDVVVIEGAIKKSRFFGTETLETPVGDVMPMPIEWVKMLQERNDFIKNFPKSKQVAEADFIAYVQSYAKKIIFDGKDEVDADYLFGHSITCMDDSDLTNADIYALNGRLFLSVPQTRNEKINIAISIYDSHMIFSGKKDATWKMMLAKLDEEKLMRMEVSAKRKEMRTRIVFFWAPRALLIALFAAALFRMPHDFYIILRCICCATFFVMAYNRANIEWLKIAYVILGILYNPFFKIGLSKDAWTFISYAVSAFLLAEGAYWQRTKLRPIDK